METHDPARQAAIDDAIRRMEWEGPAIPGSSPVGKVIDERHPDTHPLAKVVLKKAGLTDPVVAPRLHPEGPDTDLINLRSRDAMEGRE